ncbi:hypothetical protein L3X38_019325 [Prunus dulcis]|uniref:FAR1 domain-containing protein n=1 Tax=Prunus dulcis TaxID=3755 RepID=A0AAD4WDA3_PRUDU|nr:hypothetical protein L3X38_019325 [Prunus dulcis]
MDYMAEELDGHSEGFGQYRLNSDSDSCDKIYIPQLRDDHEPKSGQGFESLDDAHEFYNNYAKKAGFSVRINSSRKNKETNEILQKEYVCSKEGMPAKGVGEKKRCRGITREGFKAKLAVVKSKSGTYVGPVWDCPFFVKNLLHFKVKQFKVFGKVKYPNYFKSSDLLTAAFKSRL